MLHLELLVAGEIAIVLAWFDEKLRSCPLKWHLENRAPIADRNVDCAVCSSAWRESHYTGKDDAGRRDYNAGRCCSYNLDPVGVHPHDTSLA